jgi:ferredoxin-nitrate reductase
MLGREPVPAYNRILLSKLLAGTCGPAELELRPRAWYEAHGIRLHPGREAVRLDLDGRTVLDAGGASHAYDALVLTTGSQPFVPPIPGVDQPHVHAFRTWDDADGIAAAAAAGGSAVVVGGGLLGLEAAAGLLARGMRVTVVELAPIVMPQQLDAGGALMLARSLRKLGLSLSLGRSVAEVGPAGATLDDGERIAGDLVVIAAGVRAEVSLAHAAGIEVDRGILVDDELRASAPSVWAVGECAEHRGTVQGLWAPVAEQARVAGASVSGDPAGFQGWTPATTLKVAGIELFAGGLPAPADGMDELVEFDTRRGTYRKLVLDGDRLAGVLLVGDARQARALSELLRSGARVPEALLDGASAAAAGAAPPPLDVDAVVCSCNRVTQGEIVRAISGRGLATVAEIGNATRAGTGCGGCAPDLAAILAERDRDAGGDRGEDGRADRSSDGNTDGTAVKSAFATIGA